jgi:hypothetical protein
MPKYFQNRQESKYTTKTLRPIRDNISQDKLFVHGQQRLLPLQASKGSN